MNHHREVIRKMAVSISNVVEDNVVVTTMMVIISKDQITLRIMQMQIISLKLTLQVVVIMPQINTIQIITIQDPAAADIIAHEVTTIMELAVMVGPETITIIVAVEITIIIEREIIKTDIEIKRVDCKRKLMLKKFNCLRKDLNWSLRRDQHKYHRPHWLIMRLEPRYLVTHYRKNFHKN